MGIFNIYFIQ
jgi:hypothetical protein